MRKRILLNKRNQKDKTFSKVYLIIKLNFSKLNKQEKRKLKKISMNTKNKILKKNYS